jgi:hypothetical protein
MSNQINPAELKLRTITPERVAYLQQTGLCTQDDAELTETIIKIASDRETADEVLTTIFDFDFQDVEELDVTLIIEARKRFLQALLGVSRG